eukprot:c45769_g1_i1 orf=74-271(+)
MPIVLRSRVEVPQVKEVDDKETKLDTDMTPNEIQLEESVESLVNPMEEERLEDDFASEDTITEWK